MLRRAGLVLMSAVVIGCAELPTQPPAEPPARPAPQAAIPRPAPTDPLAGTIQAWRERALQHRAAGDLAYAAIAWHVLTLLAPDEPAYRRELASARAAIRNEVAEQLKAADSALRSGDQERANAALLRALAADPDNTEAAQRLRDLERRSAGRVQAERAARARVEEPAAPPARAARRPAERIDNGNSYDLEQGLEMFTAGDTDGGLRELRAWVDRHPRDGAGRQRAGAVVFERGQELETKGAREQAVSLYDVAIALRGDAPAAWAKRTQALRKTLSAEYYDRAVRVERSDLGAAIAALETSLKYDPANLKASTKLSQLRVAQTRLKQIDKGRTK
jgi:tetratricopeptide (TPR) repeat protein